MGRFQEVIEGEKPVLVDFHAEWCGPCKTMAPELKKLVDRMGDRLRVIKVDVDRNPEAAAHYGIQGVPTLILFRQGRQLWRQSGAMTAGQLERVVSAATGG
ncbi:MAG: thioredoxin [Chitinophagia bacterium]|nr:thioredoxin [Chitinophagia bacterium]